jgi:hypothetical protein
LESSFDVQELWYNKNQEAKNMETTKIDAATLEKWRPLHQRFAKGESLSAEEQAFYDATLQQLDAEEEAQLAPRSIERVRQTREALQALEAEYDELMQQYRENKKKILALESLLDEKTRQQIGIGGS